MNEGIHFIEKHYNNLYKQVKSKNTSRNINKYTDIKNYFKKINNTSIKLVNSNNEDRLYNLYYDKYITTNDKELKEKLKKSLKPWLDYLIKDDQITPFWCKYYIFQGMVKLGSSNEDKGVYNKRTSKTKAPFLPFNKVVTQKLIKHLLLHVKNNEDDNIIDDLIKNEGFIKIYLYLLNEYNMNKEKDITGKWIKYTEGNMDDAYKMFYSLKDKNTSWCLNEEKCAIEQIMGSNKYKSGDFYIYYTMDDNRDYIIPRLAIKVKEDSILEIRGVEDAFQNIESILLPVVEEKLKEFDFLSDIDKEYYLKAIDDYKKIIDLLKKTNNNIPFSKEELEFIYEVNDYIYFFETEYNKRIDYIRERHIISDKDLLLKASKRVDNIVKYADNNLKNDFDTMSKIVVDKVYMTYLVGDSLKSNKEFMKKILEKDAFYIRNVSGELRKDKDLALIVLRDNLDYFRHMSVSLLKDEEFIKEASKIPGFTKKYLLR